MTSGVRVDVRPFEPDDARTYVELARRAFEGVSSERRPRDTVERVAHLHGDANPAGRALVALARLDGVVVGHASALPARHVDARGAERVARQIGCFVVDPSAQGRGVGRALLTAITAAAGERVHAYPNARSAPVFEAVGYVRCAEAPARVAIGARRSREVTADLGNGWTGRALEVDAVRAPAPSFAQGTLPPGFVRDASWFAWRFLDPALVDAYRFAAIAHRDRGEHVVALASHVARGVAFGVLADALPALDARSLPAAVRAAAAFGASRFVYFTTNLPAVGGLTQLGTRVPARFDPRPVVLYARPDDASELASTTILTADWMGF